METIVTPISVPKEMTPYLQDVEENVAFEQRAMLLYPLIRRRVISHGRAAEILGVPKLDLIDCYDQLGIPYLNQTREELDEEIAGFAQLREKRTK